MSIKSEPAAGRRRPGRPRGSGVLADRTQLLAAAESAIRDRGPDATMEEIAAAANVSKPILYRTIGDKQALATMLSEALVGRIDEAVVAATVRGTDPRAQFADAVRAYLGVVDAERNLFEFVNTGNAGVDTTQRLVERSARQMVELFSSGGRDRAAARTWAYAVVGALQIATLMWMRDEYSELDRLAEDLTQLLWPGIAGAEPATDVS